MLHFTTDGVSALVKSGIKQSLGIGDEFCVVSESPIAQAQIFMESWQEQERGMEENILNN